MAPPVTRWRDRYGAGLCLLLVGYACLGRGFASVGVPPLFLGEAMLGLGLLAAAASGTGAVLFTAWPGLLLLALLGWVAVRVVPGVQLYGLVALRDAVIAGYGLFAVVVAALLAERPARLMAVVRCYARFARWFGLLAAPVVSVAAAFWAQLPVWPVSGVPIISLRPGEIAVHLVGIVAFTLAGLGGTTLGRAMPWWIASVALGVALVLPSRGAMLACVLPIAAAVVLTRQLGRLLPFLLGAALLFAAAFALDLNVPMEGGRAIGPQQLVDNVSSLLGSSDTANLDNTKAWRLGWWHAIEGYTFGGDYFWTGKGFGQSLAESDGFVVGEESGGPPLRSPHNAHLTVLARTGVPGLFLWVATFGAWFASVLHAAFAARRRNQPGWSGLFIWVACYLAAILIDASFDVALEGPMLGIWFWCLFGFGVGAVVLHRASGAAADSALVRARMRRPYGRAVPGLARLLPGALLLAALCGSPHPAAAASCAPGAVTLQPGRSVQAAVDASPAGTAFCFAPGVFRLQSVVPKTGQRFTGRPGSILSGARVLAGFRPENGQWAATADDPVGADHGACVPDHPACARPAGLFIDGQRQRRAATAAGLAPGWFFFDPDRRRVVLPADPGSHPVEWATTRHAFSGPARDVTIENLVIESYANPAQSGAVWPGGTGWRLSGIEARNNNGVGLVAGTGGTIEDCDVHGNGQLGLGAGGAVGAVIRGNHVWNNNTNGFDPDWEAGGIKAAQSRQVVFRDNHVDGNAGPGLWCDEECRDVVIAGNLVENNAGPGIFYEISSAAAIRNNVLRLNGSAGPPWFWGAEIQVAASNDVVVSGNDLTVRPGGRGIMLIDQNRARAGGGMYRTSNDQVEGNRTLFLGDGVAGGASDAGPGAANAGIIEKGGNRFDRNAYLLRSGAALEFIWGNQLIRLASFREQGQERNGDVTYSKQ